MLTAHVVALGLGEPMLCGISSSLNMDTMSAGSQDAAPGYMP